MAPIIEVRDDVLETLNPSKYTKRDDLEKYDLQENYIKLPSGIYISRQTTFHGKNWYDSHELLQSQGASMITMPKFVELLRYSKENDSELYNEITQVKSPWRSEYINASFEEDNRAMYIITRNVKERLDKDTLMEDRGISLDSWLANPTEQGLPRKDVESGELYYFHPRNNSVAGFYAFGGRAGLSCGRNPSSRGGDLGVRAVRRE